MRYTGRSNVVDVVVLVVVFMLVCVARARALGVVDVYAYTQYHTPYYADGGTCQYSYIVAMYVSETPTSIKANGAIQVTLVENVFSNSSIQILSLAIPLPVVSGEVGIEFALEFATAGSAVGTLKLLNTLTPITYTCTAIPSYVGNGLSGEDYNIVRDMDIGYRKGYDHYGTVKLMNIFTKRVIPINENGMFTYITNQIYMLTFTHPLNTDTLVYYGLFRPQDVYFGNPILDADYTQTIDPSVTIFDEENVVKRVFDIQLSNGIFPPMSGNSNYLMGNNKRHMSYNIDLRDTDWYFYNGATVSLSILQTAPVIEQPIGSVGGSVMAPWDPTKMYNVVARVTQPKPFTMGESYKYVNYTYPFGILENYPLTVGCTHLYSPYEAGFAYTIHTPLPNVISAPLPLTPLVDNSGLQLESISATDSPIDQNSVVVLVSVVSATSGVYGMRLMVDGKYFDIDSEHLIQGNAYKGTYEYHLDKRYKYAPVSLIAYSRSQKIATFKPATLYYGYGFGKPPVDPSFSLIDQIIGLDIPNRLISTLPAKGMGGVMTLSLAPPSLKYILSAHTFSLTLDFGTVVGKRVFMGTFDSAISKCTFSYYIPGNLMNGTIGYRIGSNFEAFVSDKMLSTKLGQDKSLAIIADAYDMIFPLVDSISFTSDTGTISWTMTISDAVGVKSLSIRVVGQYDRQGYTASFPADPSILESGDKYSGKYTFTFAIDPESCRSQSYVIEYFETIDEGEVRGTYLLGNTLDVHPFMKTSLDGSHAHTCASTNTDTTAPVIQSSHMVPAIIDTTTPESSRKVLFSFIVADDKEMSRRHVPVCYFTTTPFKIISAAAEVDPAVTAADFSSVGYKCAVTIPYGFGAGAHVSVSVYGIYDKMQNYVSFSADNPLNTSVAELLPYIESASPFYMTGGVLTIYGTGFGQKASIECLVGSDKIKVAGVVEYTLSNTMAVTLPSIKDQFTIRVVKIKQGVDVFSDFFSIVPQDYVGPTPSSVTPSPSPSPTPTPTPITCKSDCGVGQGYGKCINGACVCNPPHNGLDCSSKTDNNTVITPDPNKPTVNVTIPGTSSGQTPEFTSFIYVVGAREIDNADIVVNNHVFNSDKWILVKEGSSSNDQVTTVQYKYLIDNSYNTTIVSTVQVFAQEAKITFGNQQLYMNPSTIKFTFNITSYPFSKSTNRLELVMLASLQSTEQVGCSYKEFVDDQSNSQYLKIQIEDRSLFGRFIKFGMIDGREQVVTNTQLDNFYGGKELSTSTSDQSYIGVVIPYYTKYALLDPDFSVLVETRSARDQANSICTDKSSKKLTTAQLIGIIVGGAVFLFIVAAVVVYFYTRKSTSPIAMKLRKIGAR
ncbi:hypothetical protein CYY_008933 [Polysphondylium violaceum]|uniref:EGF-like domain-containing protein n=1 Tax=Polysphondylium violaceum TaxID=133409 RepID=A0A8J4V3G2_9MYCE|nr:hypothetical protein CYY_008933 [Polysphondylium violaceum]